MYSNASRTHDEARHIFVTFLCLTTLCRRSLKALLVIRRTRRISTSWLSSHITSIVSFTLEPQAEWYIKPKRSAMCSKHWGSLSARASIIVAHGLSKGKQITNQSQRCKSDIKKERNTEKQKDLNYKPNHFLPCNNHVAQSCAMRCNDHCCLWEQCKNFNLWKQITVW